MGIRTLTVSELTNYLKRIITHDPILNNLVIKGEISNFKLHNSGHAYFSIKDSGSKLKCVMFSSGFEKLDFLPKDGMNVVIKGYISIYERNGEYQLYVSDMKRQGLGELYEAFEKLKKELEAKGYFDEHNKKGIPLLPKKVAVVTSPTGAAIRDVISVMTRRNNYTNILVYPVLVQGEKAALQIAEAIDDLNKMPDIDLIILTRGGGSIEELWAFNEEVVARSIYYSHKPIISAVGHETDFTIADFVADFRAPTPSAAGEISVPNLEDIKGSIQLLYNNLKISSLGLIKNTKNTIDNYNENRIQKYLNYKMNEERQTLDNSFNQLHGIINNIIESNKKDTTYLGDNLNALSPLSTISRGYGIILNSNKDIITSVQDVSIGQNIDVMLKNGFVKCTVDKIEEGEKQIEE